MTEFVTEGAATVDAQSDNLVSNDFLLRMVELLTIDGGDSIVSSELGITQAAW